ncbi:MAG TPA: hypothetical protein VK904_06235 [Miltoncostaeaceae bacterium]|nr:hypothetical protein [Miltoncostaeaceae bacterium]
MIAVAVSGSASSFWLPSGDDKDSRSGLGAAVLGGAVVAFALLFFEGEREDRADHLAERQTSPSPSSRT